MSRIVRIEFENPADLQRWQDYVQGRADTHCTDQGPWRLLYGELYGYPNYSYAWDEDGRIRGIVSVYLLASPLFGRLLVTSPFFGYGGLYADTPEIEAALLEQVEQTAREVRADFIEFRLLRPLHEPYQANTDFLEFDLHLGETPEACWKQVASNVRQNIRKSRKHALTFDTTEDPGPAYTVISRTVRDLGTPFHGRRLFELVRKYFPDESCFSEVRKDGALVAAGLVLRFRDHLLTPFIGSYKHSRSTAANYCQYWGIVEQALEHGVRCFELGRSPKDSSHDRFKRKWGAEAVPIYYNYRRMKPGKEYKYTPSDPPWTFVMASAVWKRLPVGLTRLLGQRLARYIP